MALKILYFLFIGWWFGGLSALLGYVLCSTIIFLPLGVLILNRLPTLVWLKEPADAIAYEQDMIRVHENVPLLLRILWFFVVGWSLGMFALGLGYICMVTVIGFPLGVWLINRVPLLLSLSRHYH